MTKQEIESILRKRIKCDVTGISPSALKVFLVGFEEAAREIADSLQSNKDPREHWTEDQRNDFIDYMTDR